LEFCRRDSGGEESHLVRVRTKKGPLLGKDAAGGKRRNRPTAGKWEKGLGGP